MKLTARLIAYLNRVFGKGPEGVLALRMHYDGAMRWKIADGVLSTTVTGGTGASINIALTGFTVTALAAYIASRPGYSVPYVDGTAGSLAATSLIDGEGDQDTANGDYLHAYTSAVWAFMDAKANELTTLRAALGEALAQMSAQTASGDWVDEHGAFYVVSRKRGEADGAYASRIVSEVGRARGTRTALSEALRIGARATSVSVTDYGLFTVAGDGTKSYGLFDVDVVVDVNAGLDSSEIEANIASIIESMRDAGTHLRKLKYVRFTSLPIYCGSVMSAGIRTVVGYPGEDFALRLDGSWLLDGSEDLDGIRNF